jgi:hypothetical protein
MATTISKKNKELTLLQAIERVVELAEDSKMSKEFMKKAKTEIQLLAKSYGRDCRKILRKFITN